MADSDLLLSDINLDSCLHLQLSVSVSRIYGLHSHANVVHINDTCMPCMMQTFLVCSLFVGHSFNLGLLTAVYVY